MRSLRRELDRGYMRILLDRRFRGAGEQSEARSLPLSGSSEAQAGIEATESGESDSGDRLGAEIMRAGKAEAGDLSRKRYAFNYRIALIRERGEGIELPPLRDPSEALRGARYFHDPEADREIFAILILNTRNKIVGYNVISIGSLNGSLVSPRELFKTAILANGAGIIMIHNHPSGDPLPSREDRELTKRIKQAGEILGIEILDHIILGEAPDSGREQAGETYLSFKEAGIL